MMCYPVSDLPLRTLSHDERLALKQRTNLSRSVVNKHLINVSPSLSPILVDSSSSIKGLSDFANFSPTTNSQYHIKEQQRFSFSLTDGRTRTRILSNSSIRSSAPPLSALNSLATTVNDDVTDKGTRVRHAASDASIVSEDAYNGLEFLRQQSLPAYNLITVNELSPEQRAIDAFFHPDKKWDDDVRTLLREYFITGQQEKQNAEIIELTSGIYETNLSVKHPSQKHVTEINSTKSSSERHERIDIKTLLDELPFHVIQTIVDYCE